MDENAVEEVIEGLVVKRTDLASRVAELRTGLSQAETTLHEIEVVLEGLRRLYRAPSAESDASSEQATDGLKITNPVDSNPATPAGSRKRIRSTDMVGALINAQDKALTRDEVIEAFETKYGFPDTWSEPRNAIGNAIARAVSRGLIKSVDRDRFAPLNFSEVSSVPSWGAS